MRCVQIRAAAGPRVPGSGRAFSLIETLIVVIILGILAGMVLPRLANAGADSSETALRRNLHIVRHQIGYYRARERRDPDLLGSQWDEMVLTGSEYLTHPPVNPLNKLSNIVDDAGNGPAGWVWRDQGNGTLELYATDDTAVAEFVE